MIKKGQASSGLLILRVFYTTVCVLCLVHILQSLIIEVAEFFSDPQPQHAIQKAEDPNRPLDRNRAQCKFLPDGTRHWVDRFEHPRERDERGIPEVYFRIYDVNEALLWAGKIKDCPYRYLHWSTPDPFRDSRYRWYSSQRVTSQFSETLEIPAGPDARHDLRWIFNRSQGIFAGYRAGQGCVQCLDVRGFGPPGGNVTTFAPVVGFWAWVSPQRGGLQVLWMTQRALYQIDFSAQTIHTLYENQESALEEFRVLAWDALAPEDKAYGDPNVYRPLLDCITADDQHHLILRQPDEVIDVSIPNDWGKGDWSYVRTAATKENVFLQHGVFHPQGRAESRWAYYRVSTTGQLEELYSETRPVKEYDMSSREPLRQRAKLWMGHLSPLIYRLIPRSFFTYYGPHMRQDVTRQPILVGLSHLIGHWAPTRLPAAVFWTLLSIVFGFRFARSRRGSWWSLSLWMLFIAAFNVSGLLIYRLLNPSSVIRCQACNQWRTLALNTCVRCGAELPQPDLDPTKTIMA